MTYNLGWREYIFREGERNLRLLGRHTGSAHIMKLRVLLHYPLITEFLQLFIMKKPFEFTLYVPLICNLIMQVNNIVLQVSGRFHQFCWVRGKYHLV
jgi:hypothetical protein